MVSVAPVINLYPNRQPFYGDVLMGILQHAVALSHKEIASTTAHDLNIMKRMVLKLFRSVLRMFPDKY